jgi:tetratricopeptide (TPR) repeat protein
MKKIAIVLLVLCAGTLLMSQQKSLETFIGEAQALKSEAKFQEAADLLKTAVSIYPDNAEAHLQYGLACGELAQKNFESGNMSLGMEGINRSFEEMETAIRIDPNSYDANLYYGIYCVNVPEFFNKMVPGVEHLQKALELLSAQPGGPSPESAGVIYQYLAMGYEKQKKIGEAKSALNQVLVLMPQGEMAETAKSELKRLDALEMARLKEQKAKEKEESENILAIKRQLESSPDDFNLLMSLGNAYMEEKNWADARMAFKEATKVDPKSKEAQFMLVDALGRDAEKGYDERIYEDQNTRTVLALDVVREMERALELDPENNGMKLQYASMCIYMPFFVDRIDKGIAILKEMANDKSLPDSVRSRVIYTLGVGYRKKGNAVWMQLAKLYPNTDEAQSVYEEYGLRDYGREKVNTKGEKVIVTFHMGFMDELAPQTAVWVEDLNGNFVKTLYVSGFSGYAKEKQVDLPNWGENSEFETDGTTGASIDWGKHTYVLDLTGHD